MVLHTIYLGSDTIIGPVYTDTSGFFAFTDLPPGDYIITATSPGHLPAHRQGIVLAADQVLPGQDLVMTPEGGGGAPPDLSLVIALVLGVVAVIAVALLVRRKRRGRAAAEGPNPPISSEGTAEENPPT